MDKGMIKHIILLGAFLAIILTRASAQTVVLDSLDVAIGYAIKNNPDLKIYKLNREKARYDFRTSKSYLLPDISANFQGQDNIDLPVTPLPGDLFGQPGQTIDAQFGKKYTYNTGLMLSKSLLDFQSKFASRVAKINMEISETNSELYKQKLTEQVSLFYYSYIISEKALAIQLKDSALADSVLTHVKQKFKQGLVDKRSVNLAKISLNNIRQNISAYQAIIDQCIASLKILLGIPAETEILFKEKIDSRKTYLQNVNKVGPDLSLRILSNQLYQSENTVKQKRALLYPKMSFVAFWGAQQYRDDFGISFDKNDRSDVTYLGLNISVPIFTGFSTHNKIQSAKISYEKAMTNLNKEKEKSHINDFLLIQNYNNSLKTMHAAKESYNLSRENAGLLLQNYEQGLVSFDTYYNTFDDYLKAEAAYLSALSDSFNYYTTILSRQEHE